MHLNTLGEETSSIFLLHTRNNHAAPTSLPVNRRGHLASDRTGPCVSEGWTSVVSFL